MNKILTRLTSATPIFFKKMQVFGVSLGTLCTGMKVIPDISAHLSALAVNGIVAGAVITLVAQCACTNTPQNPSA